MDLSKEASYSGPLSTSPLLPLLLISLLRQKHTPDSTLNIKNEYDYIVVGGGTAGSVVASRLSEIPCVNVLIIEAGPAPPISTEVPILYGSVLRTNVDWNFTTVPQMYAAFGHKNRQLLWNAGKMLGGSGSHNGLFYVRGNRMNYDNWAAQGAKGWSYADVFPYFLKLEDNKSFEYLANGYHGFGGPVTVQRPPFISEIRKIFNDASKELGYEPTDINAAKQTGFYDYQLNTRDSQRCSSVKAYLVPADHRPNLDILLDATVTKILIENNQATGVEFYQNNTYRVVKATKEVIMSASTINTPKILMLSGIGPKEELWKCNIPVKADLPVGKNLQDHSATSYYFTVDKKFSISDKITDFSTIQDYINYRTGPLSSSFVVSSAFLKNENLTESIDFPSYQFYVLEMTKSRIENSQLTAEIYQNLIEPIDDNRSIFGCQIACLQPRSRGFVTLSSSDPFDPPVINPNYLAHPSDLEDIVNGLKTCKKLLNSKSVQRAGVKLLDTLLPGCESFAYSEEEYFRCWARTIVSPTYHEVGTAKMGKTMDPTTVVDTDLRVKGIKGLRVVDASVMPIIPSGNTNIPTIMVAEKASDIIKSSINCLTNKF